MRKIVLYITYLLLPQLIHAQWNTNPTVNNVVCNTNVSTTKGGHAVVIDASDNTFIAWEDSRNSAVSGTDIYLQKLSSFGNQLFAAPGILICNADSTQTNINMMEDGSGGVIIVWQDNRVKANAGDIYMQRVDASGAILWATNGITAITTTDNQISPVAVKLNATEFAIVWRETRNIPVASTTGVDLFSNKYLISNGSKVLVNDVEIVKQPNTQQRQTVFGDGSGGFFCIWEDPRSATTSSDIYAHRINNDGTLAAGWNIDGNVVADITGAFNLTLPQFTSDNAGGFIAAWTDNRIGTTDQQVYAQRMNGTGVAQWAANGVLIAGATGNQNNSYLISDGGTGAIIVWGDNRVSTTNRDIYAQRVDATGAVQWTANGVAICTATGNQPNATSSLNIVPDGAGGAVICWDDARLGTSNLEVYAQRINNAGSTAKPSSTQWSTVDGVPVGTLTATNQRAPVMVPRASAGESAVIVFLDSRGGTANGGLYASSINNLGLLPLEFDKITAARVNDYIKVNWTAFLTTDITNFEVLKSTNGTNFNLLQSVNATLQANYSIQDNTPVEGMNYYRIKVRYTNGEITLSKIVAVRFADKKQSIVVNPNPVLDHFKLDIQNLSTGNYTVSVVDAFGKIVFSDKINITNTSFTKNYTIENFSKGMYQLVLRNEATGKVEKIVSVIKQ
jgi:Secretion system C-terminal sorting domain